MRARVTGCRLPDLGTHSSCTPAVYTQMRVWRERVCVCVCIIRGRQRSGRARLARRMHII
jgi:hypothetical protein